MITEQCMTRLGFQKQRDWTLDVLRNDDYPTRLVVLGCKEPMQVFIEQAEFTGDHTNGISDSDWSWERGDCVTVNCDDTRLAMLVQVLTEPYLDHIAETSKKDASCSGISTTSSNFIRSACSQIRTWPVWKLMRKLWRCCTAMSAKES